MFYTSKLIQQTTKSLCILEMIEKANNQIESLKAKLNEFDKEKDCFAPVRLMWRRDDLVTDITEMEQVAERLVQYYTNTVATIVEKAITRSQQLQTIN